MAIGKALHQCGELIAGEGRSATVQSGSTAKSERQFTRGHRPKGGWCKAQIAEPGGDGIAPGESGSFV
jgi:hypothetical protein